MKKILFLLLVFFAIFFIFQTFKPSKEEIVINNKLTMREFLAKKQIKISDDEKKANTVYKTIITHRGSPPEKWYQTCNLESAQWKTSAKDPSDQIFFLFLDPVRKNCDLATK